MLPGAVVFITLLVIASVLLLTWPYIKMRRSEKDFFSHEKHLVYNLAMDKDYYLINKVELIIDGKKIHFDHILFGEKYIYCIGCNYRKGALSGKFVDTQWLSYENGGNKLVHITNPLKLHKTRIDYLKSAVNAEDIIQGICVVNDECIVDEVSDAPENILILNQKNLRDYILSQEKKEIRPIDPIQLDSLVQTIYKMSRRNNSQDSL